MHKTILENLRELERHKDAASTKGKLLGKDVLKYRIEQDSRTTVPWVDRATKLPVRLEYESSDPKETGPGCVSTKYVMSDLEWDPELPKGFKTMDELFSTTPPKGYKIIDRRKRKGEN